MNFRRHLLEAVTLILAAVICALVANSVASRERRMALVGDYPNALKVPAVSTPVTETSQPPTAATSTATATVAMPVSPAAPMTMTVAPATTTVATTTAVPSKSATPAPLKTSTAPATAAPAPSPADVFKRFPQHPDKPYVEIGYADAAALHQAGALFLDARRTSIYEQGHIVGARPYSVWESDIDEKVKKLFDERGDPQQQALPIVAYCSGGDCEDSHTLAQKLWGIQFNNVYVYKDGFPDWQKHGAPVKTGTAP